jgi:hypothetical protein
MSDAFLGKLIEVAPYAGFYIALVMLLQRNHEKHCAQLEKVYDTNINRIQENYDKTYKTLYELYERKKGRA